MDHEQVAGHYNARPQETRDSRRQSRIYHLRQFNNWLKFVLIDLHTRPGNSALDLCCGKGGDLNKWIMAGCTSYVGCDIAEVSVGKAAERFNELSATPFRPTLLVGDLFAVRLSNYLEPNVSFDIVSCQFSMHYAFENEKRVRQLLQNVSERLNPGGFYVGTTIDANVLVRKFRAIDELEISTAVYRIRFDDKHESKRFLCGNPFGIRYTFSLDQSVVDCPEYLVHFPSFAELANEYELELIMLCNFHDFFTEFTSDQYPHYRRLLSTWKVVDEHGTISPDEWDAIYLYTAFAFKKLGKPSTGTPSDQMIKKQWDPIDKEDIIIMKS